MYLIVAVFSGTRAHVVSAAALHTFECSLVTSDPVLAVCLCVRLYGKRALEPAGVQRPTEEAFKPPDHT